YDIIKEGTSKIANGWEDYSWGISSNKFDSNGNLVSTLTSGKWGAISFKRNGKNEFGAGTLHFNIRAKEPSTTLQVTLYISDIDDYVTVKKIENVSTTEMTEFNIAIKESSSGKYSKINIQDIKNKGVTLYLNDVYFTADNHPVVDTTTDNNNNNNNKSNNKSNNNNNNNNNNKVTTTPPNITNSGVRYDIIIEGTSKIANGWEDYSWGISSNKFDSNGNLVSTLTSGKWGAVSFKRNGKNEFGAGTLHFKIKAKEPSTTLQVTLYISDIDDYVTVKKIENVSTTEMTEFNIAIKESSSGKYSKINIQDIKNKGVTLYLNDVYFTADNTSYAASSLAVSSSIAAAIDNNTIKKTIVIKKTTTIKKNTYITKTITSK
ncbi:carbohydrate-binding module family 29 protein, partial [Piromyces sp. E2]